MEKEAVTAWQETPQKAVSAMAKRRSRHLPFSSDVREFESHPTALDEAIESLPDSFFEWAVEAALERREMSA